MTRLPIPGSDDGTWGGILNDFLSVEHNADGTLKSAGSIAAKYTRPVGGIPKTDLSSSVQASLDNADAAGDGTIPDGSIKEIQLNVPAGASNGTVLTKDSTAGGGMKWAPISLGSGDTISGLIADDSSLSAAQANSATLAGWGVTNPKIFKLTTPGVYSFYGDIDISPNRTVREIEIGTGVVLQQTKNPVSQSSTAHGLTVRGYLSDLKTVTADVPQLTVAVTLDSVTNLAVDDMVYLFSTADSWCLNNKYQPGCLRRIVAINGLVVTVDSPIFRAMTASTGVYLTKANMHPSVWVHGNGAIRQSSPDTMNQFWNSLARMELIEGLRWEGVELYNGSNRGLDLSSVQGADIDLYVHHLRDTSDTHLGYGLQVAGGSRNVVARVTAHHVRHAVTTNGWQVPNISGFAANLISSTKGEPEQCDITVNAWDCYSQEVDTHEPGHGLVFRVSISSGNTTAESGGRIAVNIRSTETTVMGVATGGNQLSSASGAIQADLSNHVGSGGRITIANFRAEGGDRAVSIYPGNHTVELNDVTVLGAKSQFIRITGSPAETGTIRAQRLTFDTAGTTVASGIFNTNWAGSLDVRELQVRGTVTTLLTPGSISNIRVQTMSDASGTVCIYANSAWPTRPNVPAGEVTWRGPTGSPTPPGILTGDVVQRY